MHMGSLFARARMAAAITTVSAATIFAASAAHSQGAEVFREFEGSWAGTGTLAHRDGMTERLRCNADYRPQGEHMLLQRLRCRSDTTSFDLSNTVQSEGNRIYGEWVETTRNVRGNLAGRVGGGSLQASAQGPGFNASIAIATRGSRQTVSIRSQGGDIDTVTMSLSRGAR